MSVSMLSSAARCEEPPTWKWNMMCAGRAARISAVSRSAMVSGSPTSRLSAISSSVSSSGIGTSVIIAPSMTSARRRSAEARRI